MSMKEAMDQYSFALKEGMKFYKLAVTNGQYPYPPVLDRIMDENDIIERTELGVVNIPTELIAGTKTEGRVSALAGNFMPILGEDTEFATKWIDLCEAHLGPEGIRDPIMCFEYLGRFYVQEGNKRASVLMSYGSPYITGTVTRLLPAYSDDHVVQIYYEFLDFYALAGIYGIVFRHKGCYARLQAMLGLEPDHVWSEEEKKRFSSTFALFKRCYAKVQKNKDKEAPTPAEALLMWLGVFSFSDIRDLADSVIEERLTQLLPDLALFVERPNLEVKTEPETIQKGFWSKLFSIQRERKLKAAFVYDQFPEHDVWTRSHEYGRSYIERKLNDKVETKVYISSSDSHYSTMEKAVENGADIIFTISPNMIEAGRRIAAVYKNVKVLTCALSQPYNSVRAYYGRLYECKFVTGAIAGAMADNNEIGYIANMPLFGTVAEINAFALGARLTNPRAKIKLQWSCTPNGENIRGMLEEGIYVISNKEASNLKNPHWDNEWGTYLIKRNGNMMPLAVPCWNWGKLYEKMLTTLYYGDWSENTAAQAVNYWWGMDSGVIDLQFSDDIPDGVKELAFYLRDGLIDKKIDIFKAKLTDNSGLVRNDGSKSLSAEEIMRMDWLCENVDGIIPGYDEINSEAKSLVRQVGIYKYSLPPEKEEVQL